MKLLSKLTTFGLAATACVIAYAQSPLERPLIPTVLECENLRMENDGTDAYFVATDSVILTGTNLELICDKLEIYIKKDPNTEATIGDLESIEKMIATGNVKITQAERVATAGLVIVDPKNEQVILREDPVVSQLGSSLTGKEIIIKRGQGIVIVPGDKENKVRFIGPSIKDLGFESKKEVKIGEPETEKKTEATLPTPAEAPSKPTEVSPSKESTKEKTKK